MSRKNKMKFTQKEKNQLIELIEHYIKETYYSAIQEIPKKKSPKAIAMNIWTSIEVEKEQAKESLVFLNNLLTKLKKL